MLYANITKDGMVLTQDEIVIETYVSVQDFVDRVPEDLEGSMVCSSSLDWPEDYTNDLDIIELADMIRGNNVSGRNPKFKSF
jgi:hypothetical protein